MRALIFSLATVMGLLLTGGGVRADYAFEFATSSGTATNSFTVNAGSSIVVDVYLTQNGTGTSNGLNTLGLLQAGVQLNTQNPNVANVTSTTYNSAFEAGSTTTGSNASITEGQIILPPVTSPTNDPNRILLGQFTFTASSGAGGQSTLSVTTLPGSPGGDNILGDGTVIDSLISNSSAVITVNAVPEPSTLLLTGLAAGGIAAGFTRRKRHAIATA